MSAATVPNPTTDIVDELLGGIGPQQRLAGYLRWQIEPRLDDTSTSPLARGEERAFVRAARAAAAPWLSSVPDDAPGLLEWLDWLARSGPGQRDPLFEWLAREADLPQMAWFIHQELAGEAGFADLVALTQVGLPVPAAKLEMARNYWDEMGRGTMGGMHDPMLHALAAELEIDDEEPVVWESLALGNLLTACALDRGLTYQSVGALGAVELTAPARAALVNEGLVRLGVGGTARRYFAIHATLDVRHSQDWNREVIASLVDDDRRRAGAIAEGAVMRLQAGARCYRRYRHELGVPA